MKASSGWLSRKRRREAAYQRGYEAGRASATDSREPVAYLRHGEQTFVQNVPLGAMWISDKDDPRAFPVYDRPQQPEPSVAVKALEPFATDADIYDGQDIDDGEKSFNDNITVGDLRRARAAYVALSAQVQGVAGLERLRDVTYAVQHNPNCPAKYLVRLVGKSGRIDLKPYGNHLPRVKHETGDILGFGKTLDEAIDNALAAAAPAKQESGE